MDSSSLFGLLRGNTSIFTEETILKLVQRYKMLLAKMTANSKQRISALNCGSIEK